MNTQTIKAIISTILVIVVSLFGALGIDVDGAAVENVLYAAIFLVSTFYGCWRNHNFTKAAQEGQKLIDELKGNK